MFDRSGAPAALGDAGDGDLQVADPRVRLDDHCTLVRNRGLSGTSDEQGIFSGEEVRILLRFATVDGISNAGEGVYVDQITVVAGEKDGCCEFDSDCFNTDLCTEDLCSKAWSCTAEDVFGSYLWEVFPDEETPQGWTLNTTNLELFWSVQPFRSVSSRYSFYGGNPGTQTYDHGKGSFAALSPVLNLENAIAPVLRFNLFADFDDLSCTKDYFQVILLKQGGLNMQIPIHTNCNGTGGDFTAIEVDLSAYSGAMVQLRFYVTVDKENNSGEGVYVDDIRVDEDGIEDPGCCAGNSDCTDGDKCTTDICAGEAGAGVCLNTPLPVVEDDFDDGDSEDWSIHSEIPGGSTWAVSDQDAVSDPFSLQASNQNIIGLPNSSWTTADSPPLTLGSISPGNIPLVVEYHRVLAMESQQGQEASLVVKWQYRTADGGYWMTGGNLESIDSPSSWAKKTFTINPVGAIYQVRVRFKFSHSCQGYGSCSSRANIDDFVLGWEECI